MQNIQTIIWDWNGTLLDDTDLTVEIIDGMRRRRGLEPMTKEHFKSTIHFPMRTSYVEWFNLPASGAQADAQWQQMGKEWTDEYLRRVQETHLQVGAQPILKNLHAGGMQQVVLSAHGQQWVEADIITYGVKDYFSAVYAELGGNGGCKIQRGQQMVQELNLQPETCLYFGDTVHDADVAKALGMPCVMLSHGSCTQARLAQTGNRVFSSLPQAYAELFGPLEKFAQLGVGGTG